MMLAKLLIHSDDRRMADRRGALASATLRDADVRPIDVTLLDISTSGCLIEAAGDLTVGARISIALVGLPATEATIVRRGRQCYGCRFDTPVTIPAVLGAGGETNIYRLPAVFECAGPLEGGETAGLPIAARVAIILSSSALLWLGIISLTTLTASALR